MARRSPAASAAVLALAIALVRIAPAAAHRTDEYLQAARIDIKLDRVELALDLVPGIAVANRVLPDIDVNLDGRIAGAEARQYAERVVADMMLETDGRPLRLQLISVDTALMSAMRQGEAALRIAAVAALPQMPAGDHRLHFRNGHRPDISVYLANALAPATDAISIASQMRAVDQRDLVIRYSVVQAAADAGSGLGPADAVFGGIAVLVALSVLRTARRRPMTNDQ